MYISPINVVTDVKTQFANDFDNECLHVVTSYGFNVNKEELAKALEYDRNQYDKGYKDAERMYGKALDKLIYMIADGKIAKLDRRSKFVILDDELITSSWVDYDKLKEWLFENE